MGFHSSQGARPNAITVPTSHHHAVTLAQTVLADTTTHSDPVDDEHTST